MRRLRAYAVATALAACTAMAGAAEPPSNDVETWRDKGSEWDEPAPKPGYKGDPGRYPIYAQIFGLEGSATVGFVIDKHGRMKHILVLASAPAGVFEAACLDYVRTFRYGAQLKSGIPTVRKWSYTCRYKLAS